MPVASLDDVVADPHLADVDFWHETDHPTEGRIRTMNPPYRLAASPPSIRRPAPRYAEHTRDVLAELGYDEEGIDRIIAEGAAIAGSDGTAD